MIDYRPTPSGLNGDHAEDWRLRSGVDLDTELRVRAEAIERLEREAEEEE